MNLIVSTATLSSGGAERVLSILSNCFVQNYPKVTFVLWKHAEIFYDIDENVQIIDIELLLKTTNELQKILWFRKFIRNNSDSVLLSFLYPYNMRVLISTLGLCAKIIIAERRDGSKVKGGKLIRGIRNLLYRRAHKIVIQTPSNKKNYPLFLQKKIVTIPNPIRFNDSLIGAAIQISPQKSIVTVGRLIKEKNHIFLIKTFKEFIEKDSEYTLTIFGEGPLRHMLESEISKLGLNNRVFLPGNVRNIEDNIINANIFVLPSLSEGMPNALFEAMSLGLPCISTKVNGAIDYIQDGVNGFLIDSNDQRMLLDRLHDLSCNEALSSKIAQNATKISDMLNQENIKHCWLNVLNQ